MTAPTAAFDHHDRQARLAQAAAKAATRTWREGVDPRNLRESWLDLLPEVFAAVSGAQLAAAQGADPYLDRVAATARPDGLVVPQALAGIASDGRELTSLLALPVITTLRALKLGQGMGGALVSGMALLDMIVRTQVSDAGRVADLVGMATRPRITRYVRVVKLPACSRCIILAGQVLKTDQGLPRHPRCDCSVLPLGPDEFDAVQSPRELFAAMDPAEQVKRFGEAGAKVIRDGGDMAQVVNARRGMTTAAVFGRTLRVTREGITRRGVAGARLITGDPDAFTAPRGNEGTAVVSEFVRLTRLGNEQRVRLRGAKAPRLMPEEILALADNAEHAQHLLRRNGYIIDRPKVSRNAPAEPVVEIPEQRAPIEVRRPVVEAPPVAELPPPVVDIEPEPVPVDVSGWTAEQLEQGVAEHADDAELLDAILAELDRRWEEEQLADDDIDPDDIDQPVEFDEWGDAIVRRADEGQDVDDDQDVDEGQEQADDDRWADYERLVDEGLTEEEAYAEAFGQSVERMQRDDAIARLRRDGYTGRGLDELARAAFRDLVDRQYFAAESATNGFLLNAAGQRAGMNPRELWTQNDAFARKWASPELLEFWDQAGQGRPYFDEFLEGLLTGEAGGRFRSGGESWLR